MASKDPVPGNAIASAQLEANKGNVSVEDAAKTGLVDGSVSGKDIYGEKGEGGPRDQTVYSNR